LRKDAIFEAFKANNEDAHIFDTKFAGEGADDYGGPYRELLTNVGDEINDSCLPLTIKSPNNQTNFGTFRDCVILNMSSTTPTHKQMFKLMGGFIGFSIRSSSPITWKFPPFFWKQLLNEPLGLDDLECFDAYAHQSLEELKKLSKSLKED